MRPSPLIALLILIACAAPAQEKPAKELFGYVDGPSRLAPEAYGSYARGCLAGGEQLAETGPTWQAMRLSRNRNWGHPDLVDFLERLSGFAAKQPGWEGLYIGDISQPRGGPMLTGHASHQMGLDADIWMLPPDRLNLSRTERENLSSISVRAADRRSVNGNWTAGHHAIIRAAASDPEVARIFVYPVVKIAMCAAETGDRSYLRKIRPWVGHHYHFHVRMSCPDGERACTNQAPPPPGDGCQEAIDRLASYLRPRDPNAPPPPPRKPKPPITLSGLPKQCSAVLK